MSNYIPLISSSLAGPLGIMHLPRLWQKVSLEQTNQLHSEYPGIGGGFDSMVLATLNISAEDFRAFIKENKPSYIECEKWVAANGTLNVSEISKLNRQMTHYHHDDDTRNAILTGAGLDDSAAIADAPNLNNLEDWTGFHKEVILG
ncbi:MAG: DUF5069 domain-containing protein [Verrucomicrobia bacterium]|nr:DUF5069 domain-containing protein [Verrucomicrobiota bacterium]MDA1065879.1 DUF5069 domain-containing protein [Verrucomicrobiota bacterium]